MENRQVYKENSLLICEFLQYYSLQVGQQRTIMPRMLATYATAVTNLFGSHVGLLHVGHVTTRGRISGRASPSGLYLLSFDGPMGRPAGPQPSLQRHFGIARV